MTNDEVPNDEGNTNDEARMIDFHTFSKAGIRHSSFVILSSLGTSTFVISIASSALTDNTVAHVFSTFCRGNQTHARHRRSSGSPV